MNDVVLMADSRAVRSHTAGPWRWELNLTSRVLQLVGGKPAYDMTVMDFRRWGMNGAQPRFVIDGLLYKAEDFKRVAPDRDHHARWFQLIDHPDANLIAAAPELLAALKEMGDWIAGGLQASGEAWPDARCLQHTEDIAARARAAVDKAEGRS